VRFSQLVVEQPWISEIDINPLLVSADRIVALDGRVVLHDPKTPGRQVAQAGHSSVSVQYAASWKMKNKTAITIRPSAGGRAVDGEIPQDAVCRERLSTLFLRVETVQRVAHERPPRICFNDYDREIALVAEAKLAKLGVGEKIIAVGRLSKLPQLNQAEFAVVVSDQWHGQGSALNCSVAWLKSAGGKTG